MAEQGIIITPPLTREPIGPIDGVPNDVEQYIFQDLTILTPRLKEALVYWNRIDVPDTSSANLPHHESTPEMKELQTAGVLTRREAIPPPFRLYEGKDIAAVMLMSHYLTLEEAERNEPGVWSLSLQGKGYESPRGLPRELSVNARTIQIELYHALPTPDPLVPISKILEFKQRRQSELEAFRFEMDSLYSQVLSSPDRSAALNTTKNKIERRVLDLFRVMNESFLTRVAPSVSVELNSETISKAALSMSVGYSLDGIRGILVGTVGAALSTIKIGGKVGRVPKAVENRAGAFAYVYDVMDRLVARKPGRNEPCYCGSGKKYKKCHAA